MGKSKQLIQQTTSNKAKKKAKKALRQCKKEPKYMTMVNNAKKWRGEEVKWSKKAKKWIKMADSLPDIPPVDKQMNSKQQTTPDEAEKYEKKAKIAKKNSKRAKKKKKNWYKK